MTRSEILAAIRQVEDEIDASENLMDHEASESSKWPEVQAETDSRIDDEYDDLRGLEARLGTLRAQLRLLPAPSPQPAQPRSKLAERMGW